MGEFIWFVIIFSICVGPALVDEFLGEKRHRGPRNPYDPYDEY